MTDQFVYGFVFGMLGAMFLIACVVGWRRLGDGPVDFPAETARLRREQVELDAQIDAIGRRIVHLAAAAGRTEPADTGEHR